MTGQIKSKPNGAMINEIQINWFGDYERLEKHHGYIQWLFPIRTKGKNSNSHALQLHELQVILIIIEFTD